MRIFYEADADSSVLQGKKVAVVGYGSQGHAQAQNLRDSGVDVVVAELEGTANHEKAVEDGFKPVTAREAAEMGDVVQILAPDHIQAKLYNEAVAPCMTAGKMLLFSHGFNIHYSQILPPPQVDVAMIAPKGPGHLVRSEYVRGAGVPALVAVEQDASGQALAVALAYGKGIGATRAGILQTTFKEETETTSSASSPSCAAAFPSWSRPASTPWWKRATSPRSPFSSACTSSSSSWTSSTRAASNTCATPSATRPNTGTSPGASASSPTRPAGP